MIMRALEVVLWASVLVVGMGVMCIVTLAGWATDWFRRPA